MAKTSGKAIAGKVTVAAAAAAAALGAGMVIPAQAAHASTAGVGYYLYPAATRTAPERITL
jgi:hypothetical protein